MQSYPVKLFNWELLVPNLHEYHVLKREIYGKQSYFFESSKPDLKIVDIGAYIGLSTLYFKRLFPQSTIMALEPHPEAFKLLSHNMAFNHISGVLPVNQAVWSNHGALTLYEDCSPDQWWSTSGIHEKAWDGTQTTTPYSVQTLTLTDVVNAFSEPIDLLKIDVEGAEWDILFKSMAVFDRLRTIVVEYHPEKGRDLAEFIRSFPKDFEITVAKQGRVSLNPHLGGLVTLWATKK